MNYQVLLLLIAALAVVAFKRWVFEIKRKRRRDYYRDDYLKSDAWKRKRYVVLRRDNWRCVYCGGRATQVHHKRYAKRNMAKNQSIGSSQSASLVMTLNIVRIFHKKLTINPTFYTKRLIVTQYYYTR